VALAATSQLLEDGAVYRTVFSVGFNMADSSRISMKGPDEDNIVWVGRKYDSLVEAETVATAIQQKLSQTNTTN
jgi:hypothetical protein